MLDSTCFDECFLFHVVTGRRYFSWKFVITVRFFQPPYCCFLWTSVLKEVHILRYLHNNNTVLILMLSSKIQLLYTVITHSWKTFVADFFMAICKPRHWNLSIGIRIGIRTDITNVIIFSSIRLMGRKLSRVVT